MFAADSLPQEQAEVAHEPAPGRPGRMRRPGRSLLVAVAAAALLSGAAPFLEQTRREGAGRIICMGSARRLGSALLEYAQDYDGCLPPARCERVHWASLLQPYLGQDPLEPCPTHPIGHSHDPYGSGAVPVGLGLNVRFDGYFAAGPFPLDNLEIPTQTALLVEAGPVLLDGPFGVRRTDWAVPWYWDTSWWPGAYPSVHGKRNNVVAADGHAVSMKVAHYSKTGHDPVLGRFGGSVYNWNGGYRNGWTLGPPAE